MVKSSLLMYREACDSGCDCIRTYLPVRRSSLTAWAVRIRTGRHFHLSHFIFVLFIRYFHHWKQETSRTSNDLYHGIYTH